MNFAQLPLPTNGPSQAPQALPLRDIKLPAEPGFWPLAPGWWLLIAILLVLFVWLAVIWYRHHLKKRRWLEINQQLSEIEFAYQQNQDSQQLLAQISVFLRRFVKFQLHQDQATTLAGDSWIAYLNQFDNSNPFAVYQSALTAGVYQDSCEYNAAGLLHTTRNFVHKQVMKPSEQKRLKPTATDTKEQPRV
jgi:hypothetical protein